ncbi:hypothetical protein QJQ45_013690 [Haematococcus lacustris]|nr:hypothetical protein QJQ45_013690 [Haematococcus lacustris]
MLHLSPPGPATHFAWSSLQVQALVPAASHQPSANSRDATLSSSAALPHAKSPQNQQGRSTTPCLPLEAVSIAQAAAQAAVQLMAGGVLTLGPSAAGSGAASCLHSSSLHFQDQAMSSSSHTASGKGAAVAVSGSVAAGGSVSQGASEESARYQRHHRHRDAEQQPQWASQPREVSRELPMHPQQQRAAAADGGSAEKVPGESMGRPHEVNRQAGGQHVPGQLHALRERPHALEADGRGHEGRAGVRRGHAVARPHGGSEHPGMDSGFSGQQTRSKQQRPGHHSRPAGVQGAGYQVSLGQDGSHRHRRHSRGPRHQVERERPIGVQGKGDKETPATPARRQSSHKHAVNQSQGMGAGGHTQQLNKHRAHPAQFSDSSLDSDGGSEAASQTSSSDGPWLATSTSHSTRPGKQLATLPGRSAGDGSDAVSSAHSITLHAVRSLPTDPRERIRARKQQDVQAYSKEQRSTRQLATMGDAGEDWLHAEELNLTPLEDDCKLLGSVLDDTLKSEVGARIYAKLAKIRGQAHAASLLERNGDSVGAGQVQERMRQELMAMPLEEALPIVRAFGHYLNLSSIAELQHRCEYPVMPGDAGGTPPISRQGFLG